MVYLALKQYNPGVTNDTGITTRDYTRGMSIQPLLCIYAEM